MASARQAQLVQFLQQDLGIPVAAIALAVRRCATTPHTLPMTLWQYGLITIDELAQIFDWLEAA